MRDDESCFLTKIKENKSLYLMLNLQLVYKKVHLIVYMLLGLEETLVCVDW